MNEYLREDSREIVEALDKSKLASALVERTWVWKRS